MMKIVDIFVNSGFLLLILSVSLYEVLDTL